MGGVCSVRRGPETLMRPRIMGEEIGESHDAFSGWDEHAPIFTVGDRQTGAAGNPSVWPPAATQHHIRLYDTDNFVLSPDGSLKSPMSLLNLCVRFICKNLPQFEGFPSLFPQEVVDKLLASLTKQNAISVPALHAFKSCEVTRLSLEGCRGVHNWWLSPLLQGTPLGKCLVHLNLSGCSSLSDSGMGGALGSLPCLHCVSLRGCRGLGEESVMALVEGSPKVVSLILSHCPCMGDRAVHALAGMEGLQSLEVEGCEGVTDVGLAHAAELPSLTKLNVSRCHQITPQGLPSLSLAQGLKQLNLGWCGHLVAGAETAEEEEEGEEAQDLQGGWMLPNLPQLERLCLARCGVTSEGLAALGRDSQGLREVSISGCPLVDEESLVELLGLAKGLTSLDISNCSQISEFMIPMEPLMLTTLNLGSTGVTDTQVDRITRTARGLTSLNLDSCEVGDLGVRSLSRLTQLKHLNLGDTEVTNAGLAGLYPLTQLKSLSLFFCSISDMGLGPVAALTGLTHLNLDTKDVGDAGLAQLVRLKSLETLNVFTAGVTDFGIAHAVCRLPSLTSFEACSGRITDRGLQHLSRLTSLKHLNLAQNSNITAAGVARLGSSLTRLRSLNLSHCKITSASLRKLTGLVNLESFAALGCPIEQKDLESLQRTLPNLRGILT